MDSTGELSCLSLCTGYGGIEAGLKFAGVRLRPIAYVEREAFAAANLVSKIEAGEMAAAPVWTDVKTFPYADFHGRVGIMLAGYPCQPFSAAGQRKGAADERHLWPYIADGIAACQPRLVFCENVEGHVTLGLRDVLCDLGRMGYRTTWGLFSAAEVGAPHQRKRVFILGELADAGHLSRCAKFWQQQEECAEEFPRGAELADTDIRGKQQWDDPGMGRQRELDTLWPSRPGQPQHGWEEPRTVGNTGGAEPDRIPDQQERSGVPETGKPGAELADTTGGRCQQRQPKREEKSDTGHSHFKEVRRQAEPQLGGTTDGRTGGVDATTHRVDRLRLLGNGVVPATAARAFATLSVRLTDHLEAAK